MCVRVIRVGVEGTRHHPAGVHALLDSVLRRQRRHGPLSLLPAPVVRRHGRGDAGRLVGLRLVDGQPDRQSESLATVLSPVSRL